MRVCEYVCELKGSGVVRQLERSEGLTIAASAQNSIPETSPTILPQTPDEPPSLARTLALMRGMRAEGSGGHSDRAWRLATASLPGLRRCIPSRVFYG